LSIVPDPVKSIPTPSATMRPRLRIVLLWLATVTALPLAFTSPVAAMTRSLPESIGPSPSLIASPPLT
jgi:hypothetical protein